MRRVGARLATAFAAALMGTGAAVRAPVVPTVAGLEQRAAIRRAARARPMAKTRRGYVNNAPGRKNRGLKRMQGRQRSDRQWL